MFANHDQAPFTISTCTNKNLPFIPRAELLLIRGIKGWINFTKKRNYRTRQQKQSLLIKRKRTIIEPFPAFVFLLKMSSQILRLSGSCQTVIAINANDI